jgi:hypothetical protein
VSEEQKVQHLGRPLSHPDFCPVTRIKFTRRVTNKNAIIELDKKNIRLNWCPLCYGLSHGPVQWCSGHAYSKAAHSGIVLVSRCAISLC